MKLVDYLTAVDQQLASGIASSSRFDSDPVAYYDSILATYGTERGNALWYVACELYDARHKED